jgi:hypothetical protein
VNSSQGLEIDTAALIGEIGGEPLTGSGFESESPESDFSPTEFSTESGAR